MANAGIDQSNLGAEDHGRRVLLLPQAPDDSARRLKERLDAHFRADIGVIISDSVGRAWRLGTVGLGHRRGRRAGAVGPARREGPVGAAAGGDRGRVRRCGGRSCRAGHGRSRGRPPGGAGARARLERARAARIGADPAQGGGPVPMSRDASTYVALSGGVGGAKLSLGLATAAGRASLHRRQHRRRLRASGLAHLARRRHGALYPRRPRQRGDGLGPARRDLDLHGCAGQARGPDLVQARRRRSGDACRPHGAAGGRRDADRHLRAPCGEARRGRTRAAHDGGQGAHGGRHRPGHAGVPGLLRARAVPPGRARHPL